jgi:CheY-like chemotaxis protein
MQLRREGHLVDIASSGPEAISALTSNPYDMIFMDIFMPGMTGLETTQHIRRMGTVAATVPVIALTGNVTPEDEALCAAAGMNGMLGKPVSLHELLVVLGRCVWPHRSDHTPAYGAGQAAEPVLPPVLSARRLQELQGTLPADTLASLVEDCFVELSERLVALQETIEEGDRQSIIAQAHAMAGMAAEYGLAALEMRLRALLRATGREPNAIGGISDELEAEMVRAAVAMREKLHIEVV